MVVAIALHTAVQRHPVNNLPRKDTTVIIVDWDSGQARKVTELCVDTVVVVQRSGTVNELLRVLELVFRTSAHVGSLTIQRSLAHSGVREDGSILPLGATNVLMGTGLGLKQNLVPVMPRREVRSNMCALMLYGIDRIGLPDSSSQHASYPEQGAPSIHIASL